MKQLTQFGKGDIEFILNGMFELTKATQSVINYLKTFQKIPNDCYFTGDIYLNGNNVSAVIEGLDEVHEIDIPIKCYLLDYELGKYIMNFEAITKEPDDIYF